MLTRGGKQDESRKDLPNTEGQIIAVFQKDERFGSLRSDYKHFKNGCAVSLSSFSFGSTNNV